MNLADIVTIVSLAAGAFFFFAGTVGMLRFPDVYTRLHALTKADNLGLGLIVFGLSWQAGDVLSVMKMFLIWGLVMFSGTTCCHLVAGAAQAAGIPAWSRDDER